MRLCPTCSGLCLPSKPQSGTSWIIWTVMIHCLAWAVCPCTCGTGSAAYGRTWLGREWRSHPSQTGQVLPAACLPSAAHWGPHARLAGQDMATATPCSQSTRAECHAAVACAEAACLESGVYVVPVKCASYVIAGPAHRPQVIKRCRLALYHGTRPIKGLRYIQCTLYVVPVPSG